MKIAYVVLSRVQDGLCWYIQSAEAQIYSTSFRLLQENPMVFLLISFTIFAHLP